MKGHRRKKSSVGPESLRGEGRALDGGLCSLRGAGMLSRLCSLPWTSRMLSCSARTVPTSHESNSWGPGRLPLNPSFSVGGTGLFLLSGSPPGAPFCSAQTCWDKSQGPKGAVGAARAQWGGSGEIQGFSHQLRLQLLQGITENLRLWVPGWLRLWAWGCWLLGKAGRLWGSPSISTQYLLFKTCDPSQEGFRGSRHVRDHLVQGLKVTKHVVCHLTQGHCVDHHL